MVTQEFSYEFDILYNNIQSNQAPGLDEYEKSVLLTKAQLEILKNYFNPLGNKYGQGIDNSIKRQIDFSMLVTLSEPSEYTSGDTVKLDGNSKLYTMPDNILFILNESGVVKENNELSRNITITPIGYAEYTRLKLKPWKYPLKNSGWRLFQSSNGVDLLSEIITKPGDTLVGYKVRYIRKPCPIILTDLTVDYDGVSIDGITAETQCELDPSIHQEILQRAVELAKATYIGDVKSTVELGQRSE